MVKPCPITLSDGRTQAIDHAAYPKWAAEQSDETLFHIIRDARQAEVAMPDGPKAGYYADEVHYCAMEVARRRGARAALDLGKRSMVKYPTMSPSSSLVEEDVNRTLAGQAQGGMTTSPDGTANRRQVKELQVKKDMFKVGDEVVLETPDKTDVDFGLGVGLIGIVEKCDGDGLPTVDFHGMHRVMMDSQLRLFVSNPKKARKPADWTYRKSTRKTANYLESNHSNNGVFIQGSDGQDVNIHFGYGGDIIITIWGRQGEVKVKVDERIKTSVEEF